MLFELKNAGATNQQCMLNCFRELIGETVEAYVADIIVKSKKVELACGRPGENFRETPSKRHQTQPQEMCFWVPRGLLLGFIVSKRGIEANPEKISAIARLGPIQNIKRVQQITRWLIVLSRFISCLGERGFSLYRLLKKADRFAWTSEAQVALDKVKELLMKAPILAPPIKKEPLLLYIAATTQVVSATLVVEWEEERHALKVQHPIYFVSEVLFDSKTCYP
jgi:hypothetical protein